MKFKDDISNKRTEIRTPHAQAEINLLSNSFKVGSINTVKLLLVLNIYGANLNFTSIHCEKPVFGDSEQVRHRRWLEA